MSNMVFVPRKDDDGSDDAGLFSQVDIDEYIDTHEFSELERRRAERLELIGTIYRELRVRKTKSVMTCNPRLNRR